MRRPTDWSPVHESADPTPGDPDEVADLAARFRRTADAVKRAAEGLGRLQDEQNYVGKGGDALRERSRDLAEQVAQVENRYRDAADALDAYHPQQHAAQTLADAALSRAREAKALEDRASRTLTTLDRPLPPGGVEDPADVAARSAATRDQAHGSTELTRAINDVATAKQMQQTAGAAAARALERAIGNDGLNDGGWDDVLGFAKQVANVCGKIAAWAGVLSLVLGWVPVLGQILMVVALIATALSLIANLVRAFSGKPGSWAKVGQDILGLATFGLGRALLASGKLAATATRGKAWQYAQTIVTGNSRQRYRSVRTLLGGPLRKAKDAIPLATAAGLLRTGVRAAPRGAFAETAEAVQRARSTWTSGTALRTDVKDAAVAMSGGSWNPINITVGLTGVRTAESAALGSIAPHVLNAAEVRSSLYTVRGLQTLGVGVAGESFRQAWVGLDLGGPMVDPGPDSFQFDDVDSTLPPDFQVPSEHIGTPAGP